MSTQLEQLKAMGDYLKQVAACKVCGKSKMVRATGHRGHGTGRNGAAYYNATGFERITLETHCTCPGGPCDQAGLLK